MGLLDAIFGNNQPPKINSILPTAAKNEIRPGRLTILNTDSLFLKRGELVQHREILYVDACGLQFGSKTYNMYVDDGNLLYKVLQLVKQRRQIP